MDYSQLPPDVLAKVLGLGTIDERQGLLQQQLAQSQQFARPSGQKWATPGGALFGGLADVLRQGVGGYQQGQIEKQQAGLIDERDQSRQMYADLIAQHGQERAPEIPELLKRDGYDAQAEFEKEHTARGEQLAQLGLMSGDRVVGGMGQQLIERARRAQDRADATPERALSVALKKLQVERGSAEMADENAPAADTYRQLAQKIGVALPSGITNRQAKELLGPAIQVHSAEMRAKELANMRGLRTDAAAAREEDRLIDRTGKLAKATEGVVPVVSSLNKVAALLGPDGFDTKADVPGIGPGQGLLIGPLGLLRGEKSKEMRAAAADLAADTLRAYSGAAASDRELMRTLERLGQGDYSDDREFLAALKRVRDFVSLQMKQSEAGVGQKAAQRLKQEGGVISSDVEKIGAGAPVAGGLPPEKKARLEELRKKKAAGALK